MGTCASNHCYCCLPCCTCFPCCPDPGHILGDPYPYRRNLAPGAVDIGIFDLHLSSIGKSFLLLPPSDLETLPLSQAQHLIKKIQEEKIQEEEKDISLQEKNYSFASHTTEPTLIENCLSSLECEKLVNYINQHELAKDEREIDTKITITEKELICLLSLQRVDRLKEIFNSKITSIKLRRVRGGLLPGQCIKFHLDYALKTMQIALNKSVAYQGGRLVFVSQEKGFWIPKREVGSGTIHNKNIVHGVTPIEAGVRYSLFFLLENISNID